MPPFPLPNGCLQMSTFALRHIQGRSFCRVRGTKMGVHPHRFSCQIPQLLHSAYICDLLGFLVRSAHHIFLANFRQPYLWEHSSYLAKKFSRMQCRKYLDSFFRFYVFLFFALTSFDTRQIQRQTSAGSLLAVTICYNPSLL